MDDFVNTVNTSLRDDAVVVAAYVLWRLNYIHPFINGNGRTARAACYFVLCVRAGGWLPGKVILPELLRRDRDEYVAALQEADKSYAAGQLDLTSLHALLSKLLGEQLADSELAQEDDQQAKDKDGDDLSNEPKGGRAPPG